MKTKTFLLSIMLLAAACQKSSDPEEAVTPIKADYTGTVTVTYQEQDYDNPDIKVTYDPTDDGKQVSITLHKIKFVPQMPVTIDVTIPGVVVSSSKGKTILTCGEVNPIAMGGESPRYKVTGFSGELQGDKLTFSLNFGDYPTHFSGVKE